MNENGLPEAKYKVWLSTDGKLTIEFSAEHDVEVLNTLRSANLQAAWQEIKNMSAELKFGQQKTAAVANKASAGDCPIHHVPLEWGTSKKGTSYKFHKMGTQMCFGHA